jgi:hypothetical protein
MQARFLYHMFRGCFSVSSTHSFRHYWPLLIQLAVGNNRSLTSAADVSGGG